MPNDFLDHFLPKFKSMSALKVYLCIMRKTVGFNKEADWITMDLIARLTGISRKSVYSALIWLQENNLIWRFETGPKGNKKLIYMLASAENLPLKEQLDTGLCTEPQIMVMIKSKSLIKKQVHSSRKGSQEEDKYKDVYL